MRRIIGYFSVALLLGGLIYVNFAKADVVIDVPGPAFNVIGKLEGKQVITISGAKTYDVSGALDALTVSQIGDPNNRPSLMEAWLASLDPSKELVPMDVAYPPDVKVDAVYAEDAAMMASSQVDAQAAALNYLGIKYKSRVYVESMMKSSAAAGLIAPGDFINSVDGIEITDTDQLKDLVQKYQGKSMKIGITHLGKDSTVSVTPKKVDGRLYVGIYVAYKYEFPFKIKVDLGDVGGPSAGTMFAIGMIDKLTPGALLEGKHVAGTGTIEPGGNVGPIGGIVQKMYAAKNVGATVFLAPSDNCEETIGKVPPGLSVYRIKTLTSAMQLLTALNEGASLSKFPTCEK